MKKRMMSGNHIWRRDWLLLILLSSTSMGWAQNSNSAPPSRGATDGLGDAVGTGLNYFFNKKPENGSVAKEFFKANEVAKGRLIAKDATGERLKDAAMRTRFERYLAMNAVSAEQFKSDPVYQAKLAQTSLNTNREMENSIEVFNAKIGTNEIAAATDQLKAAFLLDENHPALLGVPRAMKERIEKFAQTLNRAENMIEARDYGNLDPLLAELKQLAPDFDATKANSVITQVKFESQTHLSKAKLAAQNGDQKTAMEELQEAEEVWPSNPDLANKSADFFNTQDVASKAQADFDRLVTENNYREISDRQLEFAPVVRDDPKREEQFTAELGKVKTVETALQMASMMQQTGNVCGAWETVSVAVKELPEDAKLNSKWAELSSLAAEFVAALNKAKEAETKNNLGYSLNWYEIAQHLYPTSTIAAEAIERLSKQILDKAAL